MHHFELMQLVTRRTSSPPPPLDTRFQRSAGRKQPRKGDRRAAADQEVLSNDQPVERAIPRG